MTESLPKGYKPWLIASVGVLVLSLGLLAVAVTAAFWTFADTTAPLWVVILGALSLLGVGLGFGGLFLLLAIVHFARADGCRCCRRSGVRRSKKPVSIAGRACLRTGTVER